MTTARAPTATYRLQLTASFGFAAARARVPYLRELGVSALYLSPIMTARAGSLSGYDVVDPTRVSDELGGEAELLALADAARAAGLGVIVDFVPNHLAVDAANPWWWDVLASGRDSSYARVFDIDWDADVRAPGEPARIVLPVLGAPLWQVLERGELRCDRDDRGAVVRYFEHAFPLADGTAPPPGAGARELAAALARQHYRLMWWRASTERINYRRFFDIDQLVGVRVEDPAVFELMHARLLSLARAGAITGVRLDHIDGLRDPAAHLDRLRRSLPDDCYVVVEKILGEREELPAWPVAGTTGYELTRALAGVFADADGHAQVARDYARFLGYRIPFADRVYAQKRRVMQLMFRGQLDRLARRLAELAAGAVEIADVPPSELAEQLAHVTACLPVYRTYAAGGELPAASAAHLREAIAEARRRLPADADPAALDAVARVLRHDVPEGASPAYRAAWLDFTARWQQLTGAVAAKGFEDTALYQEFHLTSLNDVGAGPEPELGVDAFHAHNLRQLARWPDGMLATTTHDSKRSEDVRARAFALTDLAGPWARALHRWHRMAEPYRSGAEPDRVPPRSVEVLVYQTLLGTWPARMTAADRAYRDRIAAYLVKATREAKLRTSWRAPDLAFERAVTDYADRVMTDPALTAELVRMLRRVAVAGALTSLAQVLLKVCSPGVPDFYQGTELWSLTLVDPDNRAPVDFDRAERLLAELDAPPRELLRSWPDARIKQLVTRAALRFRRDHPDLFARGSYLPITVTGARADHVCAFERRLRDARLVCAVARRTAALGGIALPLGRRTWRDTVLETSAARWTDVLTGRELPLAPGIELATAFRDLPVALLWAPGAAVS